jgi:streptomycin 6-kinase
MTNCTTPERRDWLRRLPDMPRDLERRWTFIAHTPFDGPEVSCAWVAPVALANGESAVLKLGMPHFEGKHEIEGLRFWDGNPTVRVVDSDVEFGALLLERCEPGTPLRALAEPEQDVVIAGLLRRLWRAPAAPHPFRPLSALLRFWSAETLAREASWPDLGLVRAGLRFFMELASTPPVQVLLATDLHAGNILRSRREPWLAIDPKPFVGDPAFDVTQHLFNCSARLLADPAGIIRRIADLTGLDRQRIQEWTFARAAAEPRGNWSEDSLMVARAIAP